MKVDLLRTALWFVPLVLTYLLAVLRRPTRRLMTALLLSLVWNAWTVLAVNVIAVELGWWSYAPGPSSFMGVPLEAWLGWTLLWGGVAPLIAVRQPIALTLAGFLWLDLVTMPSLQSLVTLEGSWLLGEVVGISIALCLGLLLFRWTFTQSQLAARAWLQVACAGGLFMWLVPSIAFAWGDGWGSVTELPAWRLALAAQCIVISAALGIRAVIEFVQRGRGTPVPYDPPRVLVTSGPYAYVRNPMQVSMALVFGVAAAVVWDPWLLTAAVVAVVYGMGLAEWHEDMELQERFGDAWTAYRSEVRSWIPTLRPTIATDATLLVAFSCGICSSIGTWFNARDSVGLLISPAEDSDDPGLRRITYLPADGPPARGVAAIARALEHIHLGWALVGWLLALPGVANVAQLIADVFGPNPRRVAGLPYDPAACDRPASRAAP